MERSQARPLFEREPDKQGGFQSTRTLETVSLAAGDWALSTTEVSWACKKPGSISGLGLFSDS